MTSGLRLGGDVSRTLPLPFPLRRRLRLRPSFSVPESLSVSGPSVSVALSPSVAEGVEVPKDTADMFERLRGRSFDA